MGYPVEATQFAENPYQPEWQETDMMHTQDGVKEFPNHHCKGTFFKSLPFVTRFRNAVDVGCRDGEYSRYLQQYFEHVFAIDARMRKFFPYNVDLGKVTHFKCGISDRREQIHMFGGTHNEKNGKPHVVECYRLDDFGFSEVDYLKIDVEGFEKKVLQGGEALVLRDKPVIVIEQNDVTLAGEHPHAAKEWLEQRGYAHVATCDRGWDFVMVHGG